MLNIGKHMFTLFQATYPTINKKIIKTGSSSLSTQNYLSLLQTKTLGNTTLKSAYYYYGTAALY